MRLALIEKTVIVSGGFDCLHVGHVRLFNEARKLGDGLVVLINNDNWLRKKKGYVFMKEADRLEIIQNLFSVSSAWLTKHEKNCSDMSVCEELKKFHDFMVLVSRQDGIKRKLIFANGGDRFARNIPERALCKKLGIKTVFNVGGKKIQSSSELVEKAKKHEGKR